MRSSRHPLGFFPVALTKALVVYIYMRICLGTVHFYMNEECACIHYTVVTDEGPIWVSTADAVHSSCLDRSVCCETII